MKRESVNKLSIVTLYAIAMGFLEAAVVIYLRNLFYPNGFNFPLKGFIDPSILIVEWIREFATIIMLVTIGLLAGKKFYEKLAYFVYAFAVWDIFYYIFLKLALNWPSSFLTWDLLFLIPFPWAGPVIAPLLCTLLMLFTSLIIINFEDKGKKVRIKAKEWTLMILGILLVLYTWLYDYGKIILQGGFAKDFFTLVHSPGFIATTQSYIPSSYNWSLFFLGFAISTLGVLIFFNRTKKNKK